MATGAAAAGVLAANALVDYADEAHERLTTVQAETFVSNYNYCAKLIGDDKQAIRAIEREGVQREDAPTFVDSLLSAMVSFKRLSSTQAIDRVSAMCQEKMKVHGYAE